jgi:hypothetical protein
VNFIRAICLCVCGSFRDPFLHLHQGSRSLSGRCWILNILLARTGTETDTRRKSLSTSCLTVHNDNNGYDAWSSFALSMSPPVLNLTYILRRTPWRECS